MRTMASVASASSSSTTLSVSQLVRLASRFGPPPIALSPEARITRSSGPRALHRDLEAAIGGAQKRVVMSSLYVGRGAATDAVVRRLADRVSDTAELKVRILLDARRGLRGSSEGQSSLSALQSVIQAGNSDIATPAQALEMEASGKAPRVKVSLFKSPAGPSHLVEKLFVPERVNEIFGVQHTKIAVFDDDVLLTGANLSESYLTDRRDRGLWVRGDRAFANFCCDVVSTVENFSSTATVYSPTEGALLQKPLVDPRGKPQLLGNALHDLLRSWARKARVREAKDRDQQSSSLSADSADFAEASETFILPSFQAGFAGVRVDERLVGWLMRSGFTTMSVPHTLTVSSPYLNLMEEYHSSLLYSQNTRQVTVVTSAPRSNGFFTAKDLSKHVPGLYARRERKLFDEVQAWEPVRGIGSFELREWSSGKLPDNYQYESASNTESSFESFHSKGLWIQPQNENTMATLIGSSNFGLRSAERDLECNFLVVSSNPEVRAELEAERLDACVNGSEVVTNDTFSHPDHLAVKRWWMPLVSSAASSFL